MSVKEDMMAIQEALDKYERSVSLPIAYPPGQEDELDSYLNMEKKQIEKLTPTDCAAIAYRLRQYNFYLLRMYNVENSRILWCRGKLDNYAANHYKDLQNIYGSFEYKLNILAKQNNVISDLLKIKDYAEQRKARLSGLTKSIEALAGTLKDNQIAKVTEGKSYE